MRLKLSTVIEDVRSSLWFLPAVSVLAAIALALALTRAEAPEVLVVAGIVFSGGADGARGMLQAVAGSVITVTSLVFSLTVVTLQLASSQYSPRLLRTFLRDTGNQIVLSVFLATYAYTLMVLRTIKGGEGPASEFVPQLAVSVAVVLAMASVAALVYYIDHIATEIRVDTMLRDVSTDTMGVLDRVHPPPDGKADTAFPALWDRPPEIAVAVPSTRSGFLTAVSSEALLRLATEHGLVLELDCRVGDAVVEGAPVAWAWPHPGASKRRANPAAVAEEVAAGLAIGFERTTQQDLTFGFRQLLDVAAKALSPGVNDPTTAVHALFRIRVLLRRLAERPLHPLVCRDEQGEVRLVVRRVPFDELLGGVCGEIRRYARGEPTVLTALLQLLRDVGDGACEQRRRDTVLGEIELVERSARSELEEAADLRPVVAAAEQAREAVLGRRRAPAR